MAEKQTDLCALLIDDVLEIITIIVVVIALIILSLITYHSVRELPKTTKKYDTLKILYYVCIITTYLVLLFTLIPSILCLSPNHFYWEIIIFETISLLVAYISLLTLLAILIYRLIKTFKGSTYELSACEEAVVITIYSITIIFTVFHMINIAIVSFIYAGKWNLAAQQRGFRLGAIGIVAISMYVITASYTIGLFAKKLMDHVASIQEEHILDETQIVMIGRAIKYVSILSLAVFFSIITAAIWISGVFLWNNYDAGNNMIAHIMKLIKTMCCFINTLCLYLQFSFSEKYYDKYCKKILECCWKDKLTVYSTKSIEFKAVKSRLMDGGSEDEMEDIDRMKRGQLLTANINKASSQRII